MCDRLPLSVPGREYPPNVPRRSIAAKPCAPGFSAHLCCRDAMEGLFEFVFGASGRIHRAQYWRLLLTFLGAGLPVGVILLTAAGLA
jgi:hypothetical protein